MEEAALGGAPLRITSSEESALDLWIFKFWIEIGTWMHIQGTLQFRTRQLLTKSCNQLLIKSHKQLLLTKSHEHPVTKSRKHLLTRSHRHLLTRSHEYLLFNKSSKQFLVKF